MTFTLLPHSIADAGDLLQRQCHDASYAAGWWRDPAGGDQTEILRQPEGPFERALAGMLIAQKLALVHSEISEALEGARKDKQDEHLPSRKSLEVELADAVIRIFDLAGALNMDLGSAIADKMAYNARRADHKPEARAAAGGKLF